MSNTKYKIADGDSLRPIAKKYGFYDWRTIYDNADNAAFKGQYPANQIVPGPEVAIPDKTFKDVGIDVPPNTTQGKPFLAFFRVVMGKGIWNLKWDPVEGTLGKLQSATLQGDTDLPDTQKLTFTLMNPPGTLSLGPLAPLTCKPQGGKIKLTWDLSPIPDPQLPPAGPAPAPLAVNAYVSDDTITCNLATLPLLWTVPLFRYYQPPTGDHFYTTSWEEGCNAVAQLGYKYEGIACYVGPVEDYALPGQKPKTVPLYRASISYVDGGGKVHADHFYTTGKPEMDACTGGKDSTGAVSEAVSLPLFRLYGIGGKHHFYTSNKGECDAVCASPGITLEGVIGFLKSGEVAGSTPLYRLYHPVGGDHFYTISKPERDGCLGSGWNDEGVVGYVSATEISGSAALHRLFHPKIGSHFYTTSKSESDGCVATGGWVHEGIMGYLWNNPIYDYEGIQCYIGPTQLADTVKLLRAFHPIKGDHFYTTAQDEMDDATAKLGYKSEGTAGYVWLKPPNQVMFYRMWSGRDHFYTMSEVEKNITLADGAQGYKDELYAGFLEDTRQEGVNVPLHRMRLPRNTDHFYTIDHEERDYALSLGYGYEGLAGYVRKTAADDAVALYRSYNDRGPMTTDQKTYVDTGRYHITFLQHPDPYWKAWGEIKIVDKKNNTYIDVWGDPHLTTDNGDSMEFQKSNLTIDLQDDTKIHIKPTGIFPGTQVSLVDSFCVIRPPQAVVVTGLSTPDGKTAPVLKGGKVQNNAAQVDSQWAPGSVLEAGDKVDQLSVEATGKKLQGGTAANQIDLDNLGGQSTIKEPTGGKFTWFPVAGIGDHFYTTEKPEHDHAIPQGWDDEGIECYIWPGPPFTPPPVVPPVVVPPPTKPEPVTPSVTFSMTCSHRSFPVDDFCHVIPRSVHPSQEKPHKDTLHLEAITQPPGQKIHWRVNCNITQYKSEQDGTKISFDTDIWQNDTKFWLPDVAPRNYEVMASGYQGGPKKIMVQVYPANSLEITAQQKAGGANLTAAATTFPKPQHVNAENAALKVFTDHRTAIDTCFQGFLKTYYDSEHDTPANAKKVQFKVFPALQLDGKMGWQEHTDHRCFFQHDISLGMTVVQANFRMPYKFAFLPTPLKKLAKAGALSFIEIGFSGSLVLNAAWRRSSPDDLSAEVALVSEVMPVKVYGVPARVNKKVVVHMANDGDLGLRLIATPLPGEKAGFKYQIEWVGEVTTTIETTQGVEVSGLQWRIIRDNDIKNVFASPQTFQLFT